ncbi:hypothetical protein ALP75_200335 [Pseudomonas syringae pv. actinidiae]|nr:hypothetical protein ALP75_200335 [Pseudomonas syringae pv. actinidiae]
MELDLYATQFVGKDFFARRADDKGGLWAVNSRARRGELRAENDLFTHAGKRIEVTRLLASEVVVVAATADTDEQELTVFSQSVIMVIVLQ